MCICGDKNINNNTKSKNTTTKTLTVCIPCLPTIIFMQYCDTSYAILAIEIVHNPCIDPSILKSQFMVRSFNRMCRVYDNNIIGYILLIISLLNIINIGSTSTVIYFMYSVMFQQHNVQVITRESHISQKIEVYQKWIDGSAHRIKAIKNSKI